MRFETDFGSDSQVRAVICVVSTLSLSNPIHQLILNLKKKLLKVNLSRNSEILQNHTKSNKLTKLTYRTPT